MDTLLNDVLIDRRLFESVKAGNGNAFESLFHKYYVVLCNYAATYLDERVEVEDVVQEVFVEPTGVGGDTKFCEILFIFCREI